MKSIVVSAFLLLTVFSCNNNSNIPYQSGLSKGEVLEVLQTSQYTYLLVEEADDKKWLALPKMKAGKGDVFYYKDGYEMNDFKSKELGRTFEAVIFLDRIGKTANEVLEGRALSGNVPVKADVRRYDIDIQKAENGITIADLFKNKENYSGKRVIIQGKVTRFNPSILKKNWIHLQDGTEFSGKYDLTATSEYISVSVGQIIKIKGTVMLDQDFGAGYFYEVLFTDIELLP
jgi:hypothetical protein